MHIVYIIANIQGMNEFNQNAFVYIGRFWQLNRTWNKFPFLATELLSKQLLHMYHKSSKFQQLRPNTDVDLTYV